MTSQQLEHALENYDRFFFKALFTEIRKECMDEVTASAQSINQFIFGI